MPFPTFKQEHHEPILCWLYGVAKGGKSTLALDFIRENQPGVVIPMDQRFELYRDLALAENIQAWPISDPSDPSVWASADHILEHLRRNFPGSGARGLTWDSITPGFRQEVEWAAGYSEMTSKERETVLGKKYKNKSALYQPKAHYMEQVAMIANYGVSCLWISHEHSGRDERGQKKDKTSITDQERLKFQHNVNLTLRVRWEGDRYGVEIEEARNRPSLNGNVLWDEPDNHFRGMWRKIAEAFYAAEKIDWDELEEFASDRQAADLALEQTREVGDEIIGAFKSVHHAANAWGQVKKKAGSKDKKKLARAWKDEVASRLQAAVDAYLESLRPEEEPIPNGEETTAGSDQFQPTASLDDCLFQLSRLFDLTEAEAKARLKQAGITSWPRDKAEARKRSTETYEKVKALVEAASTDGETAVQDEIKF